MEVFKCLNITSFVILDSYAHLSSSLSKLVENLPEERKQRLRSILKPDQDISSRSFAKRASIPTSTSSLSRCWTFPSSTCAESTLIRSSRSAS